MIRKPSNRFRLQDFGGANASIACSNQYRISVGVGPHPRDFRTFPPEGGRCGALVFPEVEPQQCARF